MSLATGDSDLPGYTEYMHNADYEDDFEDLGEGADDDMITPYTSREPSPAVLPVLPVAPTSTQQENVSYLHYNPSILDDDDDNDSLPVDPAEDR